MPMHGGRGHGACVPVRDVDLSTVVDNRIYRYEGYACVCERHGVGDKRTRLLQMLVVDRLLANFDRHWGNLGILMDSESRSWLAAAPPFDAGGSLWCDRVFSGSICRGRRGTHPMPFSVRLDRQLERDAENLSWLDSGSLADVPGIVADGLGLRQLVDNDTAWIDEVCSEVESRAADGRPLADRLSVAERGRAYVTQQAAEAVAEASLSSSTLPHGHGGRRQEVR